MPRAASCDAGLRSPPSLKLSDDRLRQARQDRCQRKIRNARHAVGSAVIDANGVALADQSAGEHDVGEEAFQLVRRLREQDRFTRATEDTTGILVIEQ